MVPDRTAAPAGSGRGPVASTAGMQEAGPLARTELDTSNGGPLKVAVLGSTGSIGQNTLEVIASSEERFSAHLLCGHSRVSRLLEQAQACRPRWLVITDPEAAATIGTGALPAGTELAVGPERLAELVAAPEIDRVVSAIVGAAGLQSTWAAVAAGKTVALANKETLVMAGPLVMQLAARTGGTVVPVDSEHSAIHQALRSGRRDEVHRVILTASGGPFRTRGLKSLATVTRDEALNHPTWSMGPKITIDSATMMNKALELIEARWLFDLPAEQLGVVVHPQSIVHSFVEYIDGSVIAQLGPPDMKLPIQYALAYPERYSGPARRFDFTSQHQLEFEPPDLERFPAVRLGYEAAARGGTAGAVLNAANEEAVQAFLDGHLQFLQIAILCERAMAEHPFEPEPTLEDILRLDAWARKEVKTWMC